MHNEGLKWFRFTFDEVSATTILVLGIIVMLRAMKWRASN